MASERQERWVSMVVGPDALDGNGRATLRGLEGRVRVRSAGLETLEVINSPELFELMVEEAPALGCLRIARAPKLARVGVERGSAPIRLTVEFGPSSSRLSVDAALTAVRLKGPNHVTQRSACERRGRSDWHWQRFDLIPGLGSGPLPSGYAAILSPASPFRRLERRPAEDGELLVADCDAESFDVAAFRKRYFRSCENGLETPHDGDSEWYSVIFQDCVKLRAVRGHSRVLEMVRLGRGPLALQGRFKRVTIRDSLTTRLELDRTRRLNLRTLPILRGATAAEPVRLSLHGLVGDLAGALEDLAARPGALGKLMRTPGPTRLLAQQLLGHRAASHANWTDLERVEVAEALVRLAGSDDDAPAAWLLFFHLAGASIQRFRRPGFGHWNVAWGRAAVRGRRSYLQHASANQLAMRLYQANPEAPQAMDMVARAGRSMRLLQAGPLVDALLRLQKMGKTSEPLASVLAAMLAHESLDELEEELSSAVRNGGFKARALLNGTIERITQLGGVDALAPLVDRVMPRVDDVPRVALALGMVLHTHGDERFRSLLAVALARQVWPDQGGRGALLAALLSSEARTGVERHRSARRRDACQ